MKVIKTQKILFYWLFGLLIALLLSFSSYAVDEIAKQEENIDPCFNQKLIWTGFREPVSYLKPSDHKNIFIISDATVTDRINKLEWKICPEGQQPLQDKCLGEASLLTWYNAPKKVEHQLYAGKNDWRIPTVDELETIIDFCTTTGAYFNKKAFPETDAGVYWTSSHDPGFYNEYVAWYVDFATATSSFLDKERRGRVRAVRNSH